MLARRSALVVLVVTALLGMVPGSASGSVARALSLRKLVRSSHQVLVGTALEAHSRWEHVGGRKRIVTYTRVRVDDHIAGEATEHEILVRTLGGRVGKIGQVVHGEALLLVGEPAVLFVTHAPDGVLAVAGMSQGHYPVRADTRGVRRLGPSHRSFELLGPEAAARQLVGRPVEEARTRIRKAWDAR